MDRPWTIGIDARGAAEVPAGRGRVIRELLCALAARDDDHRYVLYCRRQPSHGELDGRFSWRGLRLADPGWLGWATMSANRSCDVFLSANSYLTTCFLRVPSAMIVHDLIAFRPEIPAQRRARRIERLTLRPAIARAGAVLCVSQSTRRDLVSRYPRAAAKATVVSLAAGAPFGAFRSPLELNRVRERHGLPASFVLSVGTLEPRKNLLRLLEAHAGLPGALRPEHPLALVGPDGWDNDELLRAVSRQREVRILGHVDDDDLAALYACCTVFCYPSLYEGFGLPVLEAMKSGAPTIVSNVSSLPEVAGDGALYVDPRSVTDIRRALTELLSSPARRTELARRGRARAAAFSWAQAAEQTLSVLGSLTH